MPNINAFEAVGREKDIFKDLSKFPPFFTVDFNKSESPIPRDVFHQIWLKSI